MIKKNQCIFVLINVFLTKKIVNSHSHGQKDKEKKKQIHNFIQLFNILKEYLKLLKLIVHTKIIL